MERVFKHQHLYLASNEIFTHLKVRVTETQLQVGENLDKIL